MSANPVLAEFVRGNLTENIHRGAFAVCDASGHVLASAGDVARPVFPRSAVKAMQALAMFKSGAVEKFGLDEEAIALACASHQGEPVHTEGVARFLAVIGLDTAALECGAHPPTHAGTRKLLREQGVRPTAIHNNCSGKHSGMLSAALALGVPHQGYIKRDHPVQKLVRAGMEELLGEALSVDRCGTDGCSIPTFAAPLRAFATAFARMATGEGLAEETASAAERILDAATGHPFLIGGTGVIDSEVMEVFEGRLMLKLGAEGVFCGAVRDLGLGFALKCDDGNRTAAEVMIAALLGAIAKPNAAQRTALEARATRSVFNWRKIEVGRMQASAAARPIL